MKPVVATFTDKYGDTRVIHRDHNGLKVKRTNLTPILALNQPVAQYIGQRIKAERVRQGLTLEELAVRAGLVSGHPKARMWQIETGTRGEGMRMGTLYAIAIALGLEPAALLPTAKEALGLLDPEALPEFSPFKAHLEATP